MKIYFPTFKGRTKFTFHYSKEEKKIAFHQFGEEQYYLVKKLFT